LGTAKPTWGNTDPPQKKKKKKEEKEKKKNHGWISYDNHIFDNKKRFLHKQQ